MRYSKANMETATAALIVAGANAETAKREWSTLAAKGIKQGHLTLDNVKAGLIAAYNKGKPASEQAKTLGAIEGSTIRGWFYDFKRSVEGGHTESLANGEAPTTTRRKVQGKAKAKASGNAAKRLPSLNDCIAGVRHYIAAAKGRTDMENGLAANAELAALVADIAAMEKRVNARLAKAAKKAA